MALYRVKKGFTFYDGTRLHEARAVVEVDEKVMKPNPKTGSPGENLIPLTGDQVKKHEAKVAADAEAAPEAARDVGEAP
jgi:hypothetical protein